MMRWRTAVLIVLAAPLAPLLATPLAPSLAMPGGAAAAPPERPPPVAAPPPLPTPPDVVPSTSPPPVGPPAPTRAKQSAAQQAMASYRSEFGPVPRPALCQRPKANENIVCGIPGRGGSPDRLPLPDQRGPPDHPRLAVGEVRPDFSGPPGIGTCRTGDQGAHCGGGIDLIGAALKGVLLVRALIDPEGASDAADAAAPHP